jgi:NAD(P)-dependent dehydrogenase (short-subunit alcohol dehydrogenase family)
VALVTGASRGLGRDFAIALAEAGADVAVTARTADELEETAELVRSRGRKSLAVPADVGDEEAATRVAVRTAEELGPVDVLVNNAGNLLYKPLVPLPGLAAPAAGFDTAMTSDEWHGVFRTHVDGPFHLLRAVVPGMLERRHGRVVNIVSNVLERVIPYCSAYDAAKGALWQMTKSYAAEWARYGVTVNAVAPGHFPSAMSAPQFADPALLAWLTKRVPMRRTGEPSELAALVVFLAGDPAGYLTGELIKVDGGETLV